MLGRRGSPFGLQLFSVAIVLIMFVYGFYLYKNVSSQLENVEKENSELIVEKEDLSKDVLVLRESKSKVEEVLKDKEKSCSLNEERLGAEIKKIRDELSKEKMTCDEKESSFNAEKEDFKQKIQQLEESQSEMQSRMEDSGNQIKTLKEENFDLKKTRQESINDVAKLNDEVANLVRKIKELSRFKELYEVQNPIKANNKSEEKTSDIEVDEDKMQIVQPGEHQKYLDVHGMKNKDVPTKEEKDDNLEQQEKNQSIDKQVAAPSLEKKNNRNLENPVADSQKDKLFKPEIPNHQIPNRDRFDVGGADQGEKPEHFREQAIGLPLENKVDDMKDVDAVDGMENDLKNKQVDDKLAMQQARRDALDDEDQMDDEADRKSPLAQNVPEIADDLELKQFHHGEQ